MKLHPRAVYYFMFRTVFLWLFFSFFASTVFMGYTHSYVMNFLCIFILLNFFNWFCCYLLAQSYRIELSADGILLDSGVLNKKHETLLYNKIQSILINRSILERILGLSTITIQNAMGKPEEIPGLDAAMAESFKNDILSRLK